VTIAVADLFPGVYSFSYAGVGRGSDHMPSGIYYARMVAEPAGNDRGDGSRYVATIKMVMLK